MLLMVTYFRPRVGMNLSLYKFPAGKTLSFSPPHLQKYGCTKSIIKCVCFFYLIEEGADRFSAHNSVWLSLSCCTGF